METIKSLVKSNIGLSKHNSMLDDKIEAYIKGYISELENIHSIKYNDDDVAVKVFIADMITWRMKSVDNSGETPKHLQARFKNLMINRSNRDV